MDDNRNGKSIKYKRRLDRTPEKNFENLPRGDKVLLSTLRTALEQAKSSIVRLRDENDGKDDIIEEERKLRRAAEDRLEKYLVDLYNNPDVNSELRQRLPRAKKIDPLRQYQENYMTSTTLATLTVHVSDDNSESFDAGNLHVPEDTDKKVAVNNLSKQHRSGVVRDNLQPLISVSVENMESPPPPLPQQQTYPHISPSQPSPYAGGFPPLQAESQYANHQIRELHGNSAVNFPVCMPIPPASISQWLPPYMHPGVFTNPLASASWSSLDSSSYQGLPSANKSGTKDALSEGKEKEKDHKEEKVRTTVETPVTFSAARPAAFSAPAFQPLSFNSHLSPGHLPQPVFLPTQVPPNSAQSYGPYSFGAHYGTDNVSHISRLLAEIATLKKNNEELRMKFRDAKRDIQLLKIDTTVREDTNLDKLAALIEEVYAAEKKEDRAVKILQAANKDSRSAALVEGSDHMRMKHGKKSGPGRALSESELTDMGNNADDERAESSVSVHSDCEEDSESKRGSWKYMEQLVARQREIMKEEMQKVINQRNEARAKVVQLEKKLLSLELSQVTDNQTDNLLAKLRITERERDLVVARLKFLTQDVNEIKLIYNLHKALLSDDLANDASYYHCDKMANLDFGHELSKNNTFTAHLSKQMKEKVKLEAKLGSMEKVKHEHKPSKLRN